MPAAASGHKPSRSSAIILVALISFLLSLLFITPFFSIFELKAYDLLSRRFNPLQGSADIIVVQIDQASLDALAEEGVTWPWPRQIYAPIFERLARAEAVFVDIIFSEPSSYGQEDDLILAEAIARAGNVTLPLFATSASRTFDPLEKELLERSALAGVRDPLLSYPGVITPIPPLAQAARRGGNVMIKPDRDGVYRRMPLFYNAGGYTIPPLALGYALQSGAVTINQERFERNGTALPLENDALLVRFPRGERPYRTISALELIRAGEGNEHRVEEFKGKKVFLGLTAAGLYDLKPTAVSGLAAGVQVHAAALDTLLGGNFIRPLPKGVTVALMALIVIAAAVFVLTHVSIYANAAFLALMLLLAGGLPVLLFVQGWYLPLIPPLAALTVSFFTASIHSYATEGRERRFVRRTFSQYMDETIVAHLLLHPELIQPGGKRKRVTVFFADIAGFTSIAERLSPEETALMLHGVLNAVSEEVISHQGVIDKYIGDCVMAFWGAPLSSEDDGRNACRAALASQKALEKVNAEFADRGFGSISMRVGLHTGDAIVGNLGSDRLFDYTVIGDTVNLASRLEGANKFFGTRVMASEDTLQNTGDSFLSRELGLIAVKGKQQPVRIYEIVSDQENASPEQRELVRLHNEGMALFHTRRWREALLLFESILSRRPEDGPATLYRDWCRRCLEDTPLTEDWNVIHRTEK